MQYSIVIPAFNESESLIDLYEELVEALERLENDWEIIIVDDGSTDETPQRIASLVTQDPRVRGLVLTRNFGKSSAYNAGFNACRGEIIVTLDADLQDNPQELSKLLQTLHEGVDLVVGRKIGRGGNEPTKTMASLTFNRLKSLLFGSQLRDSNSGYRVMRREVMESLHLYGDLYRFIPDLALHNGFRVAETGVQHRPRPYGRSKYGPRRFWTGLLDLLSVRFTTAFTEKPLHFFGTIGLFPVVFGLGLEGYVLVCKFLGHDFQTHLAAIIIGVMLILLGFQLVGLSLIGEMIAAQRPRQHYVLRRKIGKSTPE